MARSGKCLFCGGPLTARSVEHVFPEWVHRELGTEHFKAVRYRNDQQEGWDDHALNARGLVEGRVCTACNNGWMRELEQRAKPTLTRLFSTPGGLAGLTEAEESTVALWGAKTAYMILTSTPYEHSVPYRHLPSIMPPKSKLVHGVIVVAADHAPSEPIPVPMEVNWRHEPTWLCHGALSREQQRRGDQAKLASYKVTMRLRRLFLTVGYWPDRRWRYVLWSGVHHVLDSTSPRPVAADLGALPADVSINVIVAVHRNLGVKPG